MVSSYGMNFGGKRGFDFSSFSVLSGILSSERIDVRVDPKANTAAFDTTNRVLVLPLLQFDRITNEQYNRIYNGFILHEVGHALFTPRMHTIEKALKAAGDIPFVIFNVVEDFRCNRLMKRRLPGAERAFDTYYSLLWDNDFFARPDSTKTEGFLDRLNLLNKVPYCRTLDLLQNETEVALYDRCCMVETFDEVVDLCKDIYEYVQSSLDETNKLDGMDDKPKIDQVTSCSESESDGSDIGTPSAIAIDTIDSINVGLLPKKDLILSSKIMNKTCKKSDLGNNTNKSVVSSMVNTFIQKQSAKEYNRSFAYNTGRLDTKKLSRYKFDDNIFKYNEMSIRGKNHGIILVVDMSGSMEKVLGKLKEQLRMFVDFCTRLCIPYTIYTYAHKRTYTNRANSIMGKRESFNQINYLNVGGGTDTIEATIKCKSSILHFNRAFPNIEKTTVVWLTDGKYNRYNCHEIVDNDTKERMFVSNPADTLFTLIDLIKGISGVKFVCSVLGEKDLLKSFVPTDEQDRMSQYLRENKNLTNTYYSPSSGYDKVFLTDRKTFSTEAGCKLFMKRIAGEIAI